MASLAEKLPTKKIASRLLAMAAERDSRDNLSCVVAVL
jgi:hypothetical protein